MAGRTTIPAGMTLQIGNGGSTGILGGGAVADTGTLLFDRSDTAYNASNVISGAGAMHYPAILDGHGDSLRRQHF